MKAETLTLVDVFVKDVQFRVPLFQRTYAWQELRNWEPLWDDVKQMAERRLEPGSPSSPAHARPHFLGALVVGEAEKQGFKAIETREVIDGQQRLTTLQLLLTAAIRVARERDDQYATGMLEPLVRNNPAIVERSGADTEFKIWPTTADQAQFRSVMSGLPLADGGDAEGLLAKACAYFTAQIREWLDAAGGLDAAADRCGVLAETLRQSLRLVVIVLEEEDDAQVIFETLNSRGAALEAADLIKNRLFLRARGDGADLEELYATYWKPFDTSAWKRTKTVGRSTRSRIDVFLSHWLTMKTGDETSLPNLFSTFDTWLRGCGLATKSVFEDIARHGRTYDDIESLEPMSVEGRIVYRIDQLQLTTAMPLLLYVYSLSDSVLEPQRRERLMRTVDSFLMRRFVCGLTTKDYNRLFSSLVAKVSKDPATADEIVLRDLAEQTNNARSWPRDEQFRPDLAGPLYLAIKGRVRIILEAVEDELRSSGHSEQQLMLTNDPKCKNALTVEHVMPQKWRTNWPEPPGGVQGALLRDELVHTLGNLTLLNDKLNPAIGNATWTKKHEKLAQHAVMLLTTSSVLHSPPGAVAKDWALEWDESRIRARSEYLVELCLKIWPNSEVTTFEAERGPTMGGLQTREGEFALSPERRALLVRAVLQLLAGQRMGLRRAEVAVRLKQQIPPLPAEAEPAASAAPGASAEPGRDRYMLGIGWGTSVGPTKAGWMVKDGTGRWSITAAGHEALERYPDPVKFWEASTKAAAVA